MAEMSEQEYVIRNKDFENLLSSTIAPGLYAGHDKSLIDLLGYEKRRVLVEHVDVLQKLYSALLRGGMQGNHPSDGRSSYLREKLTEVEKALEIKHVFNFIIPVLMKDYGVEDKYDGIRLIKEFTKKVEEGNDIWAACVAIAPEPAVAFRYLLQEIDNNKLFAHWLASNNKKEGYQTADYDLFEATKSDDRWSQEDLDKWHVLFQMVGAWDKFEHPDDPKFTLAKDGYAIGSELEVRNRDSTVNTGEEGKRWEVQTQHTTDHKVFADYLESIKKYFVECEAFFTTGYYWDLHVNVSLTQKGRETAIQKGADLSEIAHRIMMPANTFLRNIHKSNEIELGFVAPRADADNDNSNGVPATQNFQIKLTRPLIKNALANSDITISTESQCEGKSDKRCPERVDAGRLEMKCCSVWAGTDVEYIMDYTHIMNILTEHPELIDPLKITLSRLYDKYNLITPEAFKGLLAIDKYKASSTEALPEAKEYEENSVKFRTEIKEVFKKIFAEVEGPDPLPIPDEKKSFLERVMEPADRWTGTGLAR